MKHFTKEQAKLVVNVAEQIVRELICQRNYLHEYIFDDEPFIKMLTEDIEPENED